MVIDVSKSGGDRCEQRRKWRQKCSWMEGTKVDLREKGLSGEGTQNRAVWRRLVNNIDTRFHSEVDVSKSSEIFDAILYVEEHPIVRNYPNRELQEMLTKEQAYQALHLLTRNNWRDHQRSSVICASNGSMPLYFSPPSVDKATMYGWTAVVCL